MKPIGTDANDSENLRRPTASACASRTGPAGEPKCEVRHSMLRRCFDWDYTRPCIYQITIVLVERGSKALGEVVVDETGEGGRPVAAHCELTELGRAILAHWLKIGEFTPEIRPLFCQIMPDHLHAILRVMRPMKRPLGNAIGGFKTGCEKLFQGLSRKFALPAQNRNPSTCSVGAAPAGSSSGAAPAGEITRLFAPGFQDTILFHEGQLENMFAYLRSNPLRLAVKRWAPTLFRVSREIEVSLGAAGIGRFSALGNPYLLERPLAQVQVSRRFFGYKRVAKPGAVAEKTTAFEGRVRRGDSRRPMGLKIAKDEKGEPLVEFSTPEFEVRREELFAAARYGAVLLSPCVSDGERQIARAALAAGLPLITMANKGFSKLQKPSGRYFDACAEGRLLMLAPAAWPYQPGEKPMTRFDATVMNRLCQWIAGVGAAEINYHGMRPANIDDLARRAAMCQTAGRSPLRFSWQPTSAEASGHFRLQLPHSTTISRTTQRGKATFRRAGVSPGTKGGAPSV